MSRRSGGGGQPVEQLSFDDLLVDPTAVQERPIGQADATAGRRRSAAEIAAALGRPEPTREQIAVIEAPVQPMLVVAGAGSGKTETMAARVVWLVANELAAPEQVLGLTFTRKAAGELSERIRHRLRALHRRGLCAEPQPVAVATYHSYAAAILADHGVRIGIEPGAQLLGEAGAWQLVDRIVESWDGDMSAVEAARSTVVDAVLALASECAEHLVEVGDLDGALADAVERCAELPAKVGDGTPGTPRKELREVLQRLDGRRQLLPLVAAYQQAKRHQEVLDFGDQVALAARIAQQEAAIGAAERARYPVVLLDEYQDTSYAQLVLLRGLFGTGHPVTAVGDPHQSIYGWRGASAGNLQRFPSQFPNADGSPATVAHLSTTWRNDRAILAAANRASADLRRPPDWADPVTHVEVPALESRPDARLGAVELAWLPTVEDEARTVAETAARHFRAGRPEQGGVSVAVLCRTRSQFPFVEQALREQGLPVEVVGLGGLLHVPEVSELRAALEVVHDPARGDSLVRLLTGSGVRLGVRDLDALGSWAAELLRRNGGGRRRGASPVEGDAAAAAETDQVDERSIIEALDQLPPDGWSGPDREQLSTQGRRRLERTGSVLRRLRSLVGLPLPDLVQEVERALLLDVEVASWPGARPGPARAHLDAFVDVAAGFAQTSGRGTLGGFLAWLTAADAREDGLEPGVVEHQQDCVQVLTVHAAKGLEWDVVAVTGLVEGTFPNGPSGRAPKRSFGWLKAHGTVPFPLRGDRDGLPHWRFEGAMSHQELEARLEQFTDQCARHEIAEERRLAYVAFTRARGRLLLTGAVWGDPLGPRDPSRFLSEISELCDLPDSGVTLLGWQPPPEQGADNPRAGRLALMDWPIDPIAPRRIEIEVGAALVRDALDRHQDQPRADRAPGAEVAAEAEKWRREVELLLAERDAVRTTGLDVELPAHLSASAVVALADDPLALAARLRRPMPRPPSPHARRGSAFHAWLEQRFGAAALVDVDDLPGAADSADDDPVLAVLQQRFLDSEWAARAPEAVEVAVETPVGDVVLRGRIDAVFRRDDGGWEVVDWKTGAPPEPASAAARAVQLAVYRLAWARLHQVGPDRVSAAFFYAGTGQTVRPVDLLDEAGLLRLVESGFDG